MEKFFDFRFYEEKKCLLQKMVRVLASPLPPPPFSTALIYIHRITLWKTVTKNSNELFLSTSLLDPIIFSDDKSVLFISRHKKNYFELLILN